MNKDNPFQNRSSMNPVYLFALLGGLFYWLIFGLWMGHSLLEILKDKHTARNAWYFAGFVAIAVAVYFLISYIKTKP